ncbi:MAG: pyridoxine 5'-phosphate synthase [Candidatus Omnitrophica bacterium]|nr:pyridoxine 5'-phosphate synthase [Candidatus Omnitrophota bacterium]
MMLGVNIDHVATLRQARRGSMPDPVAAAVICEKAGCDSIVAHLREDRRHINDDDVRRLRKTIKTRLNLEMSTSEDIIKAAIKIRPDQATLVPENRDEVTTEGGLDVLSNMDRISDAIDRLQSKDIKVSLFIDPESDQVEASKKAGAGIIEIHTGKYANAREAEDIEKELSAIAIAADIGLGAGLVVNAGHGLDYKNVKGITSIKGIEELNIGHSIIAYSVFAGIENAVKEMLALAR